MADQRSSGWEHRDGGTNAARETHGNGSPAPSPERAPTRPFHGGYPGQPVVRVLWRSTNGGRTWEPVDVLARSPLSGGVSHDPDGWWDDGYGNLYRNAPPGDAR